MGVILRKLGKLPARVDAIKFKLRRYIDRSALPTPPLRFGHFGKVDGPWGDLGNSRYGNCVWAGGAHETMVFHAAGRKKPAVFNDKCVLADYSAQTGFDPKRPSATDNGTDMQEAAAFRVKTGLLDARGERHKIMSYVALEKGDPDELALACYLFGAVGVGIMYPATADKQFDAQQPWDVAGRSRVNGGHYIPIVGRNSKGNFLCVTWGRLHAMTPAFYRQYSDEAVAYLSDDILSSDMISPEGFHIDALRRDLEAL